MAAGREAEIGSVAAAIEADEPVVVTGEAGIGKTTVARTAAARTGRPLVTGGAFGALRHVPLLAVEHALGRPLGAADELAAARHLERATGPGVLLLEDLQWAHPATLDALALLAGRLAIVATVRTGEGDGAVTRLVGAGYREVALAALDEATSADLVRAVRPDLAGAEVAAVVRAAGGNPLLLEELARSASASLPSDLALALGHRLAALDPAARAAAAALAVADRPLAPDDVGPGWSALVDAGLVLVDVEGTISLRHGLVAEAIRANLGEADVAATHRRLAAAAPDDATRARHLVAAGPSADAIDAAGRAREGATTPGERAHWAAVALRLDPCRDPDAALDAARAVAPRDPAEAQRLLEAIDPPDAISVAARAACLALLEVHRTGDVAAAIASHEQAAAALRGSGTRWEAMVELDLASLQLVLDLDAGAAAVDRAVERAEAIGHETARARITKGNLLLATGRPGWDDLFARTAAEARTAGDLFTAATATRQRSIGARLAGRPADGVAWCLALADDAEAADLDAIAVDLRAEALAGMAAVGRFADVAAMGGDLLDRPLPAVLRGQLLQVTGRALAVLGHTAPAVAMLEELVQATAGTAFDAVDADELAMAWWVAGDASRAAAVLERADPDASVMGMGASPIAAGWVAIDRGHARTDLVAREGLAAAGGAEPLEVDALLRLGRGEDATDAFLAAAAAWRTMQAEDDLRCRWAAGEAARRAGREDAVLLLRAALDAAEGMGASAFVARGRRSLADAGVRVASPTDEAGSRVSTLTRRELEALRSVADGATTDEAAVAMGVSRRTVESFIASAVRKVGASTRAEAIVVALADGGA